jgi:hypothetical protein
MPKKESELEFWTKAVKSLRKEGYKGIHSVYSGANAAFKKYFDGASPVDSTTRLAAEGKLVIRPTKNGVMIYLPTDVPDSTGADKTLKTMGLA